MLSFLVLLLMAIGMLPGILAVLFLIGFGVKALSNREIGLKKVFGPFSHEKSEWQFYFTIGFMAMLCTAGLSLLSQAGISYLIPAFMEALLKNYNQLDWQHPGIIVLGVFFAPVLEELFFRGILFQLMVPHYSKTRAVVILSLLFGLLHFDPLGAVLFALLMSVIYIKTESLFFPILLHILNNALVFLGSWVSPALDSSSIADMRSPETLGIGLTCALVGMPFLILFLRKTGGVLRT